MVTGAAVSKRQSLPDRPQRSEIGDSPVLGRFVDYAIGGDENERLLQLLSSASSACSRYGIEPV